MCWFLLSSLIIGLLTTISFAQSQALPQGVIIRTSTADFDRQEVLLLFEEARIAASLRRGAKLSFEQLRSYPDRYRVLVEQLQARLIASQPSASVSPSEVDEVLRMLSAGRSLRDALTIREVETTPEANIAPLWQRLETTERRLRKSIEFELARQRFANALLAKHAHHDMFLEWFEQSVHVDFEAVTVPRVPTSREIDAAVVTHREEIAVAYANNRGRFNKPPKILATRIRVPWDASRTAQSDAMVRRKAQDLRNQREAGTDLAEVLTATGDAFAIRKRGHVTLNARTHPDLASMRKGERSQVTEDDRGAGFYEIKMHAPAFVRRLEEETVQRELAAELLRDQDRLPNAYRQAQLLADTWVGQPKAVTATAARIQGSRRIPVSRFAPYATALIPGLGTSKVGSEHLKNLKTGAVSGQPVSIRQDYVIFRVHEWVLPHLAEWWKVAPTFWREYEPKAKRRLLHQWLNTHSPKSTIQLNSEVIASMKL